MNARRRHATYPIREPQIARESGFFNGLVKVDVPKLYDGARQSPNQKGDFAGGSPVLVTALAAAVPMKAHPPGGELAKGAGEKEEPFEYVIDGQTKTGTRRVVAVNLGGGVTLEFVRIPKGSFAMGSPKDEADRVDHESQHRVEISRDYYLGKFEVTQAQFKAITGEDPSDFKGEQRPVERVSWDDAVKFCRALPGRVGRAVELPTEAEWEYACRAGTATPFHSGAQLGRDDANFDRRRTVDVGSYPANPWGLLDMHGNVWEWCRDYYGTYDKLIGSRDPFQSAKQSDDFRDLRGGAWWDLARFCRGASRRAARPYDKSSSIGFRVCLPVD